MSCRFDNIIGNEQLKSRLSRDIESGTLSHAYIVEGPAGSGRTTLALNIVAALSCKSRSNGNGYPCGECRSCERILSRTAPDVMMIDVEDGKAFISVEAIRNVKNDVYTAPNELPYKVYVIQNADAMTEQAQNAFLLLLESPPPYAMFFLICKNAVSLLETVRSRAPTLRMERLDNEAVKGYLLAHERRASELYSENPYELELAVFAGDGSIGASIALLDTKKRNAVAESREIARKMISVLNSRDKAQTYALVTSLGNKRTEICRHLSYLEVALRDLILIKKSEHVRLCFFENEDEAYELSSCFSLSSLFCLYDATSVAISSLEANTNVRLTLTFMMQSAGIL